LNNLSRSLFAFKIKRPSYPSWALEGFLLENEPLAWHFDKPLVVIEHGKMPLPAASDPMAKQSEAVFRILQKNLADRFETWTAARGKDEFQRDQPELVTQSIRDVTRESAALDTAKLRRSQVSFGEWSANLPLARYGRVARHPSTI
jgi:hypothetical protein